MIETVDQLEKVVGGRPKTAMLKSIPVLDEHCAALLAASPIAVVSWVDDDGVHSTVVGGEPGHARAVSDTALLLAADRIPPAGAPVGAIVLVPGYGETLRVNGHASTGEGVVVDVEEAFLHCAKAILRSELWLAAPGALGDDPSWRELLAASPFVTLGTVDRSGRADVSPKGDPAGFVVVLDDDHVLIPDRPGNRRTDTLHNLIDDVRLSLVAFVPGDDRVLELRGTGDITADQNLLAQAAVRDRVPKAGIVLTITDREVRREPGLERGRPWDADRRVDPASLPRASCIWTDHVKLNEEPGLLARVARKAVTPGMMDKGLARDYEHNLY